MGKETKAVNYTDFVNKELVLFSNMDNERSIPSLVDGLKPGQRKVLFTCLKRKIHNKEIKVAQLAGSVAEISAYHHGEASLMGTIIGLAQNFIGSNNINLLEPHGQFGTRLQGGKDSASPRYINTKLSPLARHVFNEHDDNILDYLMGDNQRIEPEWYCPILPMVLVNGADGIGTGWSTKIPNYNPREIVKNLKKMLNGEDCKPMTPWFKNFRGTIEPLDHQRYVVNGEIASLSDTKMEITELPARNWTQNYKDMLEGMVTGNEKQAAQIKDYKDYSTDTTVKFIVEMKEEDLRKAETQKGVHVFFKLQTTMSTTSMVLFDSYGCLRRFDTAEQIMQEFYDLRLKMYDKRKKFMMEELSRRGYDSDPVKAWQKTQKNDVVEATNEEDEADEVEDGKADYNYLLSMPMWNLTQEKKDALCKNRDERNQELKRLQATKTEDMWRKDLDEFIAKLDQVEAKENEDMASAAEAAAKMKKGGKKKGLKVEALPSAHAIRVDPVIADDLKAKASKAVAAKERKDKGEDKKKPKKEVDDVDEFDP